MGIKNKQRRAAKAKRRAKEHSGRNGNGGRSRSGGPRDGWSARPLFTAAERVRGLLELAAAARRRRDGAFVAGAIASLADDDTELVDRESEDALLAVVALVWDNGWQPAELVRHARRVDARAGRLVATAVAADHAPRDPLTLHRRWSAQVDALHLPAVDNATGWIAGFAGRESLGRLDLVTTVVVALEIVSGVGPLNSIIPPPGADARSVAADHLATVDSPVLVRVRALLAQAESTTFEAEADAFTAKAQELMARHAIDMAVLWAQSSRDERPTTIRLPIDDPYADIKSLLLQRVAEHSRCTAVYHPRYSLSSIIGFHSDVAATEMLFTSLLVQSQTALRAEAAKAGPGGRTRSRSFRSSFLLAYTNRVDQRLAEINSGVETTVEPEHTGALLPVLAARHRAVDDVVAELFGTLQSNVVRGGSDAAGWACGTMAADLAQLNFGNLDDSFADDTPVRTLALECLMASP